MKPVKWKIVRWGVNVVVGATLFFAGVGVHVALSRDERAPAAPPRLDEMFARTQAPDLGADATFGQDSVLDSPAPASRERGPFSYKFTPGERLDYRLETQITGQGIDIDAPSDILLDFWSDMSVVTESVDSEGNGDLRIAFDTAAMEGSFMEVPFALNLTGGNAYVANNDQTLVDASQDIGSVAGLPQVAFLQHPISSKVSPTGQVLSVSGVEGFSAMLTAAQPATNIEFPHENVQVGEQWVSDINLPIPGFGTAARARIVNTLDGFTYLGNRYCGVIVQEFVSDQYDGTLDSPESAFGEAMQFKMPLFELYGMNVLYFDVNNGCLVFAELGLQLVMRISQLEEQASGILGGDVASLLSNALGGALGDANSMLDELVGPSEGQDSLLDFTVGINGTMALVEAPAAQPLAGQ